MEEKLDASVRAGIGAYGKRGGSEGNSWNDNANLHDCFSRAFFQAEGAAIFFGLFGGKEFPAFCVNDGDAVSCVKLKSRLKPAVILKKNIPLFMPKDSVSFGNQRTHHLAHEFDFILTDGVIHVRI